MVRVRVRLGVRVGLGLGLALVDDHFARLGRQARHGVVWRGRFWFLRGRFGVRVRGGKNIIGDRAWRPSLATERGGYHDGE